jgi:small-conductance mechanosensitive channel
MMFSYQARIGLGDLQWLDPSIAAGIFLLSLILALIFHKLLFPLILRFTRWTPTNLDSRLVRATRRPITLGIVVLGAYLALTLPIDLVVGVQRVVDTVAGLLGLLLGIVGVASAISNTAGWYLEKPTGSATQSNLITRLAPLFRRIGVALVYVVGGLLMLSHLGVDVTPLIAGLGLGGLAVALAIQPTLANLFAGTYVMTEGVISTGDYIEMEGGVAGYVVDVGWRSVRIRTWQNNLVVVPNSRFAETIVTNTQVPAPQVNVYLTCGVSYDSDLYQVERVCREVMGEVLDTSPHGIKEFGGYFGFEKFGDSNVDFWLFVQAKDRAASFELRSALIQKLHWRLNEEGIVINYPVRTLQFPDDRAPQDLLGRLLPGQKSSPPTTTGDTGQGGGP